MGALALGDVFLAAVGKDAAPMDASHDRQQKFALRSVYQLNVGPERATAVAMVPTRGTLLWHPFYSPLAIYPKRPQSADVSASALDLVALHHEGSLAIEGLLDTLSCCTAVPFALPHIKVGACEQPRRCAEPLQCV